MSAEGNALLIEASETVSYVVRRPDALTVSSISAMWTGAFAGTALSRKGVIAGVSLEQARLPTEHAGTRPT